MKHIYTFLLLITLAVFISCDKKMDHPKLIKTLQEQVDDVMKQDYQITQINIYSKNFVDYGPSDVGYLNMMFIRAIAPDPTIKHLANFSYSASESELKFLGYPNTQSNERKEQTATIKPDLVAAMAKLDEMKKQIPEGYKYEDLLEMKYVIVDGKAVYEFKLGLKPLSEDVSHPMVRKKEKTYSKHTTSTNRKHRISQNRSKTEVKKMIEYAITFRLIDNQIETRKTLTLK